MTPSPSLDLPRLLHVTGTLHELAADPRRLSQLAPYLRSALGLQGVTFAIVCSAADTLPTVVTMSTASRRELSAACEAEIAALVLSVGAGLAADPRMCVHHENHVACVGPACGRQYLAVRRGIDSRHRLVLLIHREQGCLTPATLETLQLAASHLATMLAATFSWQASPRELGVPFTKLTEREWAVLCGLNSDESEKQLAQRFGLSPHTLHSHIKAIYRKVGVQGRLPLLQCLMQALRDYRLRRSLAGIEAAGEGAETRLAG